MCAAFLLCTWNPLISLISFLYFHHLLLLFLPKWTEFNNESLRLVSTAAATANERKITVAPHKTAYKSLFSLLDLVHARTLTLICKNVNRNRKNGIAAQNWEQQRKKKWSQEEFKCTWNVFVRTLIVCKCAELECCCRRGRCGFIVCVCVCVHANHTWIRKKLQNREYERHDEIVNNEQMWIKLKSTFRYHSKWSLPTTFPLFIYLLCVGNVSLVFYDWGI